MEKREKNKTTLYVNKVLDDVSACLTFYYKPYPKMKNPKSKVYERGFDYTYNHFTIKYGQYALSIACEKNITRPNVVEIALLKECELGYCFVFNNDEIPNNGILSDVTINQLTKIVNKLKELYFDGNANEIPNEYSKMYHVKFRS